MISPFPTSSLRSKYFVSRAFTSALVLIFGVLLNLAVTQSAHAQVAFNDVAVAAGVGSDFYGGVTDHGGGINWLDYNNDGWPDLFMINGAGFDAHLYRNLGNGSFSNKDGLLPSMTALELTSSAFADYDNDGDVDIYIGVAATLGGPDGPANILLQNQWVENGNMTLPGQPLFVDVAAAAGVQNLAAVPLGPLPGFGTYSLAWLDYDVDGCVDLYVGNMAWNKGGQISNANALYRNMCDGTFLNATVASGLTAGGTNWYRPTLALAAGHLNSDIYPDLYVVNVHDNTPWHNDFMYLNNGDGTFTEVADAMPGVGDDTGAGMGLDFGDIDLDGDWDIYISDLTNPGNEPVAEGNALYMCVAEGTWGENSAPAAGVASNGGGAYPGSWGVTFFDADLDGYEDLFVGVMGAHELYINDQDGTFTDITSTAGLGAGGARASAAADYDRDGDIDIAVMNMGGNMNLYRNVSTGPGNWLEIDLEATTSNLSAIGARVDVTVGGNTLMRQVKGGTSTHAQNEDILHFGVAGTQVVSEVAVYWPSGIVQRLYNVPANQVLKVTELEAYTEAAGLVSIEAENRDSKVSFNAQRWDESTAGPIRYSGDSFMASGLDVGTRIQDPNSGAPTLYYTVDFSTAGTYYIWVRAHAPNNAARRVHVGLDGVSTPGESQRIRLPANGTWAWSSNLISSRATLNVASAGVHTVSILMGEDGMLVDKLVLTTDAGFTPVRYGPAESPRGAAELQIASELPGDYASQIEVLPTSYGLKSSYPNPFTSSTTIRYATPSDGMVTLTVYDLLGRQVATLVDEVVPAGRQEILWNASDLPNGTYFVRLAAGSYVATERVSLVR